MESQSFGAETKKKDKEILISIVNEMAESMTGAQSTRHWREDVLWFDIPAFASKGVPPALKMFDTVFGTFKSCKAEILETDIFMNGNMGIVCTVQKINILTKKDETKSLIIRQTDCFEKRENKWNLFHEHASVPSGGQWDGKYVSA
jgi:ketosteroid isomerase-like protein